MRVRNFWIECEIDGRQTKLTGGPQAKDGGFEMEIFIRKNGSSISGIKICGIAYPDGELRIDVLGGKEEVEGYTTRRVRHTEYSRR